MSKFDKKKLSALSQLARIQCSEEEQEKLSSNLNKILTYIDQLKEVETEGVPTCNHVLEEIANVMREDEPGEALETQTFLANSPSHVGGMVRVPPVIKF